MARLYSTGFELNSITAGMEFDSETGNFTIITNPVRSGTYSGRSNPNAGTAFISHQYAANNPTADYYVRFYLRITAAPAALASMFRLYDIGANGETLKVRMNNDRTLELWNDTAQLGTDSAVLGTSTWYRVEVSIVGGTATAYIDGVQFATGSVNASFEDPNRADFGFVETATADITFDDIAINNNSGSFQNSLPGEGEIIHLRPNALGDNAGWTGTFADVDEVTPDDNTTKLVGDNDGLIEDVNIDATPAALAVDDTINCVQVGVRFNDNSSGGETFNLRIKASSGGTVEEGSNITPTNATWMTHSTAVPRNYNLTLYDLPGASTTAWTKADLDTAQIGVNMPSNGGDETAVSTLWLLVDHKPAGAPAASASSFIFQTTNRFFGS